MNKWSFFAILCCILLLCALPAMAQEEQALPVITITYASDASLSQEAAVDAQITVAEGGQESSFQAKLRLNKTALDLVEKDLPQQSLYIEGAETRFVLYNDGGDALRTKLLSTACSGLVAQCPVAVPVRTQEPVEVYVNGDYRGLYSRREDIADAIARFEGLDSAATLNVTDVNKKAFCGDASGIANALQQLKGLNLSLEADRQTLSTLLDTESFLNWAAVNAFFGNLNMNNDVIFYQVGNGPIKCAMGDFAYALMFAAHNPYASLNTITTDVAIIIESMLLNQPEYREAFLTKLGALYQALPTQTLQQAVDAANAQIASALPRHMERWTAAFIQAMAGKNNYLVTNTQEALLYQQYSIYRLRDKTLVRHPWYLYDLTQSALDVSDADMLRYFGSEKPALIEVPAESWETYKAANQ